MTRPIWEHITIIGTGLLGGSIGLALLERQLASRVTGVGRRQETLDRARERGCLTETTTDLSRAVRDSDLVILATPIRTLHELLNQLTHHVSRETVITDVGSTKSSIVSHAERVLPESSGFVGSHPMAGSEMHGPDAARSDLFVGKPCIITPTARSSPQAVETVAQLWRSLGMQVRQMTPAAHDDAVARISHLPHALACLIVEMATDHDSALEVASTGFADTTRVASGDPAVWKDIFSDNARQLERVLDDFQSSLDRLREMIRADDPQAIEQYLKTIKATRDQWCSKRRQSEINHPTTNPTTPS